MLKFLCLYSYTRDKAAWIYIDDEMVSSRAKAWRNFYVKVEVGRTKKRKSAAARVGVRYEDLYVSSDALELFRNIPRTQYESQNSFVDSLVRLLKGATVLNGDSVLTWKMRSDSADDYLNYYDREIAGVEGTEEGRKKFCKRIGVQRMPVFRPTAKDFCILQILEDHPAGLFGVDIVALSKLPKYQNIASISRSGVYRTLVRLCNHSKADRLAMSRSGAVKYTYKGDKS